MYLKSLTLKGFKSFAQPTTFEFEPGVTAIVGPNGSGKSNVVDALAWVMGEQGAKTLRGGKMEDVIFAGTSTRGPLGRAEVKLTIDNSDGALPIEYAEVTISRILFRNGASEYAINGEGCRLLDVQELLSDSGLGREMHVIVGQGQLDAVLRATPEDRRGFIEEAAGILKHRRRKERTLRKLEAMETNLTRLNDLAGEIRRQLKPLGRQAEVARQAQHIAAEARDAKSRLLANEVFHLREELSELTKDDAARHSERIVLQEQLEQKTLRVKRIEQEQHGDDVDTARRVTLDLERVQHRLQGLYSQVQQRLTFLATQADTGEQLQGVSQQAIEEANAEAERLAALIPDAEAASTEAQQATRIAAQELDAIDEHIAQQSALVSQHDLELAGLRGRVETAKQSLETLMREAGRRGEAHAQAEERLTAAQAALAEFTEASEAEALPETEELERSYAAERERHASFEQARDQARDAVHELQREHSALSAKISALLSATEVRDASGALEASSLGRVSDHVQVEAGHEAAVNAALGVFSDAVLVADSEGAQHIIEQARDGALGRLGVVIASAAVEPGPAIDGLVRVADVVTAPDGVLGVLGASYIASDLAAAIASEAKLQDALGGGSYTLVTPEGDVLTPHTMSGGAGESPSRLELIAERDRATEQLEAHEATLEKARVTLEERVRQAKTSQERVDTLFQTLRTADATLAEARAKERQLVAQHEAAASELARVAEGREATTTAIREAEARVVEAERLYEKASTKPRPILDASSRDEAAAFVEKKRDEEVELRLTLETARERARAQATSRDALIAQHEREQRAAEEAARRAVLRARQVAEAERVSALLPAITAACDRSLAEARVKQQEAEALRAKQSQELTLLRSEEAGLRARLQKLTESAHSSELRLYERKLHLSSLLERAGQELGLVEEVLIAEYGPDVPIPVATTDDAEPQTIAFDVAEQEARLRKAERALAELGRINPLALEEFAALEQRHSFLSEQLTDLQKTRADLVSIIEELDSKMEGIFVEAFNDTKNAFGEIFPILFPGGSGDISLTDPENMLETGIDVAVRPAGKNIERLSLLSGGERSLAAVAWLIAIFHARPSPFYIMDEVEAALDDANLGRLLQAFETLREHSQLIVITHQKRTMEIADALYGVSMRQDGVSAVIGQRVGKEETGAEAGL
ncbi:chromosome segregation protein SMC [Leucobacter chinensis]|uniref:chromosome segregation protein SMC n=1 Tax=Leucobacter chinensis TaxID=2851010 RepID=UPI001C247992